MYKQIIIARKDLRLSSGKLAAQVSHASMAFLTNMIREHDVEFCIPKGLYLDETERYHRSVLTIDDGLYSGWINGIFTKCILEAKNKNQLLKAKKMAEDMGMKEGYDFFLIKDNCLTELEPEEIGEDGVGRTLTCIGFRPMEEEKIHAISRKYQLYHDPESIEKKKLSTLLNNYRNNSEMCVKRLQEILSEK